MCDISNALLQIIIVGFWKLYKVSPLGHLSYDIVTIFVAPVVNDYSKIRILNNLGPRIKKPSLIWRFFAMFAQTPCSNSKSMQLCMSIVFDILITWQWKLYPLWKLSLHNFVSKSSPQLWISPSCLSMRPWMWNCIWKHCPTLITSERSSY